MKKKFDQLCAYLLQADLAAQFSLTFTDICRKYHVSPRLMNNIFYDVFGLSGEEFIDHCRSGKMKIVI